jgi:hypothetical protein
MNARKKELTEEQYEDILDEIYPEPVLICGMEYNQAHALKELDPIAFRCSQSDYQDDDSIPWVCDVCDTEHDTEESADNCCKVSHLVDLLERAGFVGTDTSITESLLTYGLVYRESDGLTLLCTNPDCKDEVEDLDDILFQFESISKDDIQSAIDEQKDGFFDYLGTTKEEYTLDSIPLVMAISDILQYESCWLIESIEYPLNIDDVIKSLKAEQNIKEE